jgi:vacuolar protein sorting-associated protein IST1
VDDSVWVRRALQIIEKLSVQAPSGEVKLKLMKGIAADHNVDWDPTDFEAELLKAPEDLLVRF